MYFQSSLNYIHIFIVGALGFISDIPGINAGYLGKTARSGNQYPYNGSIENIKVFNTDIPDDTLTAWTLSGGF